MKKNFKLFGRGYYTRAALIRVRKLLQRIRYFQPVPDFEMTITPLNSKFSVEFEEVSGISRHFHEAQTLNFLRVKEDKRKIQLLLL